MKRQFDPDVTIAAWLEDGPFTLPVAARQVVVTSIHLTPQRRQPLVRLPWRFPSMNAPLRVAAAAVIGVLLLGGAYYLFGGGGGPNVGSPASPSSTPTPIPLPNGELLPAGGPMVAGTYVTDGDWADPSVNLPVSLTVPDGWANAGWAIEKPPGATASGVTAPGQAWISFWTVANTYTDPCRYPNTALDPPLGPTVDDFITALTEQVGTNATAPKDISIDGRAGKMIEMDVAGGTACDAGEYRLWIAPGGGDASRWTGTFTNLHDLIWAIDVPDENGGSIRLVIDASLPAGATDQERADVLAIIESIRIGQPEPESTPAPSP